jgi:hypothetical protein
MKEHLPMGSGCVGSPPSWSLAFAGLSGRHRLPLSPHSAVGRSAVWEAKCQLLRAHHWLHSHVCLGVRAIQTYLHSSSYFLVTVHASDSDCFISATKIFSKPSSEWPYVSWDELGVGRKKMDFVESWRIVLLWPHTPEKKRGEVDLCLYQELHSLPSSSRML